MARSGLPRKRFGGRPWREYWAVKPEKKAYWDIPRCSSLDRWLDQECLRLTLRD